MANTLPQDTLTDLLGDGWIIVGYATNVLEAGAVVHSVLLQRDRDLVSAVIGYMGVKEISRVFHNLSPAPVQQSRW